jgi:hypothetical protein
MGIIFSAAYRLEKVLGCTPAAATQMSSSAWLAGVEKAPSAAHGVGEGARLNAGSPNTGVIFGVAREVEKGPGARGHP